MTRSALPLVVYLLAGSCEPQAHARSDAPASAPLADLEAQIAAVLHGQASFDLWVPDELLGQESLLVHQILAKGLTPRGYTAGEGGRMYHYGRDRPTPRESLESDLDFMGHALEATLPVLLGFFSLAALVRHMRMRRRIARDEARGGCVACGSLKLRIEGDIVSCEQCNYTGRADRGGVLVQGELPIVHPSRRQPRPRPSSP